MNISETLFARRNAMRFLGVVILVAFATVAGFSRPTVLITYHSRTGNTQLMAQAVADGARESGLVEVVLKPIAETTTSDLLAADAIILGSPVHNANVSPEVQAFIASWPFDGAPLRNKIGAAFVTAGGLSAGEELVKVNILQSMLIFGMIVVGGEDWTAPFGASAITNEGPFTAQLGVQPQFINKGKGLGRRVAQLAVRMEPQN